MSHLGAPNFGIPYKRSKGISNWELIIRFAMGSETSSGWTGGHGVPLSETVSRYFSAPARTILQL
jgi:hypothetical protein